MSERERLAAALVDLCWEHGYRGLTLEMLLERAEVDQAAFERHFDDLEDCFCEIYGEMQEELMGRIAVAVAGQSWRDGLRATAYSLVEFLEQDERRTQMMWVDVRTAGERAGLLMARAFEEIFDLLDEGRREAQHEKTMSRATAEAVGGTIFTQMYAAYQAGSMEAVRAKVPEMMYMAVLPYLGPEAAREELRIAVPPRAREASP